MKSFYFDGKGKGTDFLTNSKYHFDLLPKSLTNCYQNFDLLPKSLTNCYQNILQGKLTNAFMALSPDSFVFDRLSGTANAIVNNVKFTIFSLNNLTTKFKFDITVQRIFEIFILKLTNILPYKKEMSDDNFKNFQLVSISLKDYKSFCNITGNQTRAIEHLRNALNIINRIHVEFSDIHFIKKNKSESEYHFFKLADDVIRDKSTGSYSIVFNIEFLKYLANSYIMPFNLKIFQINLHKNPNSYQLARRLLLHHNMNFKKTNANTISVKTLLDAINTPTYEQIKQIGRLKQKIIIPFERDLHFLQQIGILDWNYMNDDINYSYVIWINSYIKFNFLNYPKKE